MQSHLFSDIQTFIQNPRRDSYIYKLLTLVLFVALCIGCCSLNPIARMERKMIFYPDKNLVGAPQDVGLPFEDVFFTTADQVRLHGWFVPAQPTDPTILFFHGNAGNISHRLDIISVLHRLNANVFIIDYRGYGKSAGQPSEKGLYLDAQAAYDYLLLGRNVAPRQIIVYGKSLGGVAAIDLASKVPVAGLVIDSSLTSAKMMAKRIVPWFPSFLLRARLDSIDKIQSIPGPKLFIHSPQDEVIPYRMGRQLYERAQGPKTFLEIQGGHNEGFFVSQAAIQHAIKDLLRQADIKKIK
jgi:fermentation-respiration switch protein FrsA (DUF1100 family)